MNDEFTKEDFTSPTVDSQFTVRLQTVQMTRAGVYLLPSGGLLLRDGSGSALIMENGNM